MKTSCCAIRPHLSHNQCRFFQCASCRDPIVDAEGHPLTEVTKLVASECGLLENGDILSALPQLRDLELVEDADFEAQFKYLSGKPPTRFLMHCA